jgi:hypothetical protein
LPKALHRRPFKKHVGCLFIGEKEGPLTADTDVVSVD